MATTEETPDIPEPDGEPVRRTTRPSLDVLQRDQQRALFDGEAERNPPLTAWMDGFDARRDVVNWFQATSARTFGTLGKRFPPKRLLGDETLQAHVCGDDESSEAFRRRVLRHVLVPACQRAYLHMRDQADELAATASDRESWDDVDVDKEQNVAMRPAFSRLDAAQAAALDELWGGFRSRDELNRWLHSLTPATRGHHPDDLPTRLLTDETAVRRLLGDSPDAATWREKFAIVVLLPSFAEAARTLQGGEVRDKRRSTTWHQG